MKKTKQTLYLLDVMVDLQNVDGILTVAYCPLIKVRFCQFVFKVCVQLCALMCIIGFATVETVVACCPALDRSRISPKGFSESKLSRQKSILEVFLIVSWLVFKPANMARV